MIEQGILAQGHALILKHTAMATADPRSAAAVTIYNLCDATTVFDKGATLTVPTDCSCFDVTQSGMHGISHNVDPSQVTLFKGSGCQASNAVPAADSAQCFNGNHELPSTDAHCDSFCSSEPALSSGLFSMKICPGEAAGCTLLPSSTL